MRGFILLRQIHRGFIGLMVSGNLLNLPRFSKMWS